MNILVVAAHPDDEVLGCGGTIARLAAEGARVSILILANGLTSRPDFQKGKQRQLLRTHHRRAKRAATFLGATHVSVLGLPDQLLDTLPLLTVAQAITREIDRVRPEIVFTHHGGDLNTDHVVAFRATLVATRSSVAMPVKSVLAYEIPSSTEWSFDSFAPQFHPNLFFDIGISLRRKLDAMAIYESETRPFPHPRSEEALTANAHRWGSVAGLPAAEAFQIIREIR